jgi:transcriptional regulator with PAS, ATPase and Fis domain
LDVWDRQALCDAARVLALVLEPRHEATGAMSNPDDRAADGAAPLIGSSACMQRLRGQIERVAATDFTLLIEGETGSGKELVARQVHDLSGRHGGPFVAVNCAALVETLLEAELFGIEDRIATGVRARRGKFEAADQGTLFLDEVAELSPSAQAKLLRAVQDLAVERVGGQAPRRVDIRVVVATNKGLSGLVGAGRFRADLYYRLAGVELEVPPLRCRREDIVELAEYFLARHLGYRRLALSESAAEALVTYDWPGNVRELQRVVERALALSREDVVGLSDLPAELTREYTEVLHPSAARAESMRAWGSRYARLVLERCDRNKRRACEVLGISYHTLQSYLRYPSISVTTGSKGPARSISAPESPRGNRSG